ncbi:MAG: hypothetical protein AB7T49_18745 [Oligoflexales bacterium]
MEIKKEVKNGMPLIRLVGAIDETMSEIGAIQFDGQRILEVNCREITRVTSIGIMRWVKSFKVLREQGIKLQFTECSPTIIRQGSMLLTGFLRKDEITSIGLPFFCEECRLETITYNLVSELEKVNFELPEISCKNCGKHAEFDDVPELYFQVFQQDES